MFLNKKKFDDDKKNLSIGYNFCVKSKFYYLACKNCLKTRFLFKIPGFFFFLNCQIPNFTMIPGKVATLDIVNNNSELLKYELFLFE